MARQRAAKAKTDKAPRAARRGGRRGKVAVGPKLETAAPLVKFDGPTDEPSIGVMLDDMRAEHVKMRLETNTAHAKLGYMAAQLEFGKSAGLKLDVWVPHVLRTFGGFSDEFIRSTYPSAIFIANTPAPASTPAPLATVTPLPTQPAAETPAPAEEQALAESRSL